MKRTKLLLDEGREPFHQVVEIWRAATNESLVLDPDPIRAEQFLIITDEVESVAATLALFRQEIGNCSQTDRVFCEKPIYWLRPTTKTLSQFNTVLGLLDVVRLEQQKVEQEIQSKLENLLN